MRVLFSCLIALLFAGAVQAQTPTAPPAVPPEGITPGEVQRLFDAYALVQAQEVLQLSDEKYDRFIACLKALQDTRRRHLQARNQIIVALRQMINGKVAGDDQAIAERMKALREEDDRAAAELRKAYDAVDETLDVRQQARFRLFEERVEQQRLELLMRARQNARPQRGRGKS